MRRRDPDNRGMYISMRTTESRRTGRCGKVGSRPTNGVQLSRTAPHSRHQINNSHMYSNSLLMQYRRELKIHKY
ncbi:hypothetical protein BASA_1603 [Bifidobacterium animalis subsp. animalis]|nr:hypothetical protein BASA_1603 [Bifidobacterium animalis subsp. animalis]